jgi:hypothetical protein
VAEWGRRRLRVWLATTSPGGPGSPSAPTKWGCPQGLDVGRMNAGESLRDQVELVSPSGPGSTVPRPKIAAVERRKATRRPDAGAHAAMGPRFRREAPAAEATRMRLSALRLPRVFPARRHPRPPGIGGHAQSDRKRTHWKRHCAGIRRAQTINRVCKEQT